MNNSNHLANLVIMPHAKSSTLQTDIKANTFKVYFLRFQRLVDMMILMLNVLKYIDKLHVLNLC